MTESATRIHISAISMTPCSSLRGAEVITQPSLRPHLERTCKSETRIKGFCQNRDDHVTAQRLPLGIPVYHRHRDRAGKASHQPGIPLPDPFGRALVRAWIEIFKTEAHEVFKNRDHRFVLGVEKASLGRVDSQILLFPLHQGIASLVFPNQFVGDRGQPWIQIETKGSKTDELNALGRSHKNWIYRTPQLQIDRSNGGIDG